MYPRNAALPEPIAIGAVVQVSDGAVQTSGVTVRIKPIGVAEANGAGTTAYSTDGIVLYTPTQAETNYTSFILIAKKTGCIPVTITVITTASDTAGYAAVDWAKVANKTATVALTGTSIESVSGSVGSVAATVSADIIKWLGTTITVNTAGIPRVDIIRVNGTVISGTAIPDVNVSSIDADVIDSNAIAASGVAKIQTGLATPETVTGSQTELQASLDILQGTLDNTKLELDDVYSLLGSVAFDTNGLVLSVADIPDQVYADIESGIGVDILLTRQIIGNKHTVVESPTGTFTIQVRNDADNATVRTIVYVPATGARTVA